MFTGYIYLITNIDNGNKYVGQTLSNVKVRFQQHISEANKRNKNNRFHNALRKYGREKFQYKQLLAINSSNKDLIRSNLSIFEQMFINL